jgi:hypothetical protein
MKSKIKKTRFNETDKIRFIHPLFDFKYILWWNYFDYIMFKNSASTEIMLAMEEYDCHNSREAMRILYQPSYSNNCIII